MTENIEYYIQVSVEYIVLDSEKRFCPFASDAQLLNLNCHLHNATDVVTQWSVIVTYDDSYYCLMGWIV